jgi:hypothetical protein
MTPDFSRAVAAFANRKTTNEVNIYETGLYLQNVLEGLKEIFRTGSDGTYTAETMRAFGEEVSGKPLPGLLDMLIIRPTKPDRVVAGEPFYNDIARLIIRNDAISDCTDANRKIMLVKLNGRKKLSFDEIDSLGETIRAHFARTSMTNQLPRQMRDPG